MPGMKGENRVAARDEQLPYIDLFSRHGYRIVHVADLCRITFLCRYVERRLLDVAVTGPLTGDTQGLMSACDCHTSICHRLQGAIALGLGHFNAWATLCSSLRG